MKKLFLAASRVAVVAVCSCPYIAQAQEQQAQAPSEIPGLDEVIVTAQKRQNRSGRPAVRLRLHRRHAEGGPHGGYPRHRRFTPGFSGNTEDGFTDALSMRGIATNDFGIGGDPSVAMFVDGIWSGRTGGVMTAMYDVERAEVVKGPQGTLFGRNSIAGAVSLITNKPESAFAASGKLTLADYDHVEANAMVNVPLSEQWALRVAGYALDNKGSSKTSRAATTSASTR